MEGRSIRMKKEMVVFLQDFLGKNIFLVQFGDGQNKDMSYSSLAFLSSKDEVEMNDPLSNYPKKNKVNC